MRTRRAFVIPSVAIGLVLSAAMSFAAPAAADEGDYLRKVLNRFAYLNAEQSIAEGAKICSVTRSGTPASDAVIMVSKDLQVSVPAAYYIVNAAVVHLC
jgi:hypothetical protein